MSELISLFQQNSHWPLVQKVVLALNTAGEKAFLAGGCVRDALLGYVPKDFDIATSAPPEKIIRLFPKSRQQGKAFGVVVVFDTQGHEVEVATFRKDGPYRDGRHPEYVEFLSDKEDALRRDFTINGLFYDSHNIIDYVGGMADIQKKIIRCVGDPETRFQEDHLRILRALRFSLKLNFPIEKKTEQSLFKMKNKLLNISKERVYEESLKILQTEKFAEALSVFHKMGLLKEWTELSEKQMNWPACQSFWHKITQTAPVSGTEPVWRGTKGATSEGFPSYNQFVEHEFSNKSSIKKDQVFLWAVAFFPLFINIPEYKTFPHRLKKWTFPVVVIKKLKDILRFSHYILNHKQSSLGKKLRILNSSLSPYILFLCKTYLKSQNKTIDDIQKWEREFKLRAPEGKLPKALVNGHDLKALGFKEDKTMASQLEQLYDLQLEQNIKDKKSLLKQAHLI